VNDKEVKIDRERIAKALLAGFVGFVISGTLIHSIFPDIGNDYPGLNLVNALIGVAIARWVWKSGNQKSS